MQLESSVTCFNLELKSKVQLTSNFAIYVSLNLLEHFIPYKCKSDYSLSISILCRNLKVMPVHAIIGIKFKGTKLNANYELNKGINKNMLVTTCSSVYSTNYYLCITNNHLSFIFQTSVAQLNEENGLGSKVGLKFFLSLISYPSTSYFNIKMIIFLILLKIQTNH